MSELPWDKIVIALLGAWAARGEVAQHGAKADADKQYAASVQVTASVYDTLSTEIAGLRRRVAELEADRAGRGGAGKRRQPGLLPGPPPRDSGTLLSSLGSGLRRLFGWLGSKGA